MLYVYMKTLLYKLQKSFVTIKATSYRRLTVCQNNTKPCTATVSMPGGCRDPSIRLATRLQLKVVITSLIIHFYLTFFF